MGSFCRGPAELAAGPRPLMKIHLSRLSFIWASVRARLRMCIAIGRFVGAAAADEALLLVRFRLTKRPLEQKEKFPLAAAVGSARFRVWRASAGRPATARAARSPPLAHLAQRRRRAPLEAKGGREMN
jgi:hypothetical protein